MSADLLQRQFERGSHDTDIAQHSLMTLSYVSHYCRKDRAVRYASFLFSYDSREFK